MIGYLVKKNKITLLFFIMLIGAGVLSFAGLPKQEYPDIVMKYALITTVYPGASPEKVEQSVTRVIEQKVKQVKGVKKILSTSSSGYSSITVMGEDDADAKTLFDGVRKNVQDAQSELPSGVQSPVVDDDLASSYIGSYAISAATREELNALSELMKTWKDQLRSVSGVANVSIQGVPNQQVQISIDSGKLQEYKLGWEQVQAAIEGEKTRVPTGEITFNDRSYQIMVRETESLDNLRNVLITRTETGLPVYLKDISTIKLGYSEAKSFAYYRDKPVITISVGAKTGSDVPSIHKLVNEKLKELETALPGGTQLEPLFAQQDRIHEIFSDLTREMIVAVIAVIIVCMLGLNLRTSAFVALAIPISLAVGLIMLPYLGISMNEISVIGLIIVLGILVDDAVVVNDNIERRLSDLGEEPQIAAIKGTKEVAISILTATLATISAFAPLIFLPGPLGAFIKPIPVVISLTMLASMMMSLTIIPIFREWYEKKRRSRAKVGAAKSGLLSKQIAAMNRFYSGKVMEGVLKRPLIVALSGLLLGTSAYLLLLFVPVELFPASERPEVVVTVTMPPGTSLLETDRINKDIARWMKQQPELKTLSYSAGSNAPQLHSDQPGISSPSQGQLAVVGKKGVFDLDKTVKAWDKYLKTNYPEASFQFYVSKVGIDVGKAVSISITGEKLGELQTLSQQVKETIASIGGVTNVKDDLGIDQYTLEFEVNKQAMDQHMVSYTNLTQVILLSSSGITSSQFDTGKNLIDVKLYLQKKSNDPNIMFQGLNVTSTTGQQIPLSQLATLKPSFAIQQIQHVNLKRTITIEADVLGRTAIDVGAEISEKLKKITFPAGYSWSAGGETSEQSKVFKNLTTLFVVVLFLILLLMTIQFYSISIPLIIMTTVYLAAAGGIIGIYIAGMPIGFMSLMGIISLAGIVVRNGIVLIEFIEDARHEGVELKEAVIQAASARFRAILLTSLTAIMGMIPIALSGNVLFRPMAYTIIFGLMFSTLLTLLVVPSLYMVVAQMKMRRQERKFNRKVEREQTLSV